TLTGSGDPVTFTVELKNVGKTASQSTTLKWFVDGNRISDSSIPSLEAGESVHRTWSHSFNDEGVFSVECSFDNDDQLSLDNESSMVVEVVNKIPFLVVDEPTSGDSDFAAARLFTATLGYENDKPMGDWQSVFEPHVIGYDELSDIAMAKYRAAVIADAPQIPTDVVDRLRSFVERGGGLWIALGKRTDRDAFNASWFDEGDGLSPLKLAKPVGHGRVTDAEFDIHPPSGDHVVTKNIADTKRLDIDEVKISRHHSFVLGKGDTDVSVLLETGVGAPLVIENYVGDGRVVIQAMPLDLQWSNMPLTNAYVVMVHDFLAYLTQPAATRFNLQPGGEISFATSEELADAKSTIETPTGDAIDITPDDRGDAALCRFAGTYLPGDYRLKFVHGDEVLSEFPFHVSRENEESDLRRLSSGQQSWLADNGGIEFAKTADVSSVETDQLPSSRPVWWLLLVTLLIVMVCELALATQSARRRYAPVV
ncbi:MAG: hypothetical protein KDB27_08885, partial [Planctomycetales bacterium]|nr:hypothetical protein [Planctomycetales bacterium]